MTESLDNISISPVAFFTEGVMPVNFIDSIPEDALNTRLIQPGSCDTFPNGLVHTKYAPCIIIAQTLQGSYEVRRTGSTIFACPGEAFLSATNELLTITHHGDPKRDGFMKARWLHVHFTLFDSIDFSSLITIPPKCNQTLGHEFGKIISELLKGPDQKNKTSFYWLARQKALVYQALALLCQISPPKTTAIELLHHIPRLIPVFTFMKENISHAFSPQNLAKMAHMSRSQFHAFFKIYTHTTPMDYVKNLRLTIACHRLIAADDSIEHISESLGFANQFHFSREFKRKFNIPPAHYRKMHQDLYSHP
jgi:AraC-like DNA-binding protein